MQTRQNDLFDFLLQVGNSLEIVPLILIQEFQRISSRFFLLPRFRITFVR